MFCCEDPFNCRFPFITIIFIFPGRVVPPVTFEDLNPVLSKAIDELSRGLALLAARPPSEREQTVAAIQRVLLVCLHLSSLMARLLQGVEVDRKVRQAVFALIKMDIRVRIV